MLSSDDILLGLGLVLVLAVSSQLLALRFGLPAIVVLLPVGFVAGIVTSDVQPVPLLGAVYQPFVSLSVGVILFEAGLRLSADEIAPGVRRVVVRLLAVGVLVTWIGVALAVVLLFGDLGRGMALLIGAILVVSGPTVVLPMLAFIRPQRRVRSVLKWEGVLVDPIGALLGVLMFHVVSTTSGPGHRWHPLSSLESIAVGLLAGALGAAVLWLLLREVLRSAPTMAVPVTLMIVVGTVAVSDVVRADTGFLAATVMGVSLRNQQWLAVGRRVDVSSMLRFQETLVQLLIGVLFILIAASVTPGDVRGVLPEALVLVAVMALVIRPLAVALATWRSELPWRERSFMAWMDPRGIVAGATASAFGLQLAQRHVAGADKVLPIAFVAIFGTVVLYGLTTPLLARALGLAGTDRGLVLIVGGHAWARELAAALQRAGAPVRMWVGRPEDRDAARAAGLEADRGRMMLDAVEREAELEEITDALLLTDSDDFNAFVAADLRQEVGHGHVYRIAPDPDVPDLLPPSTDAGILGTATLTFAEMNRRFAAGARIVTRGPGEAVGITNGEVALCAVSRGGRLRVAPEGEAGPRGAGDTLVVLTGGGQG